MPYPYTYPFTYDDYIFPVIEAAVAFESDPFDASPTWTDITDDVLELHTHRGRQHELDRMEAGTAVLVLNNSHGNYWPYNTGGSYYPYVKPAKKMRIKVVWEGTVYSLWTGFAEEWAPGWLAMAGKVPVVALQCACLIKNMSRLDINSAGFDQELSGTRIDNALDLQSANIGRDLDAGISNMIATGALADEKAQSHLFKVQESELGIMFIAPDGDMQFHDRHARLKSPYTTSQATFGDDVSEMEYSGLEPKYGDDFLYNDVRMTRSGGTQQSAEDATSQASYGKRTLPRTGLLLTGDTEVLAMAQYLRSRFKDPVLRARVLQVHPQRNKSDLFAKVFTYDVSTRITVRLNQASIDQDYHIEGVSHDYVRREGAWATKWELSDAASQKYWAIGVAGFSEIGETTKVSY